MMSDEEHQGCARRESLKDEVFTNAAHVISTAP
jgi:hypothetical protein